MLWILAGASIAGGFVTLWSGGTTLPASLLVLGYCVLVPLAIMRRRDPVDSKDIARAPYAEAVIAALAVFALYVFTLPFFSGPAATCRATFHAPRNLKHRRLFDHQPVPGLAVMPKPSR